MTEKFTVYLVDDDSGVLKALSRLLRAKGDIPTSVRAMKAGAIDFLTKPVKDKDLFEAVSRAEARDAESRRLHFEMESMQAKVSNLTPREREVLTHVVAGRLNKQ